MKLFASWAVPAGLLLAVSAAHAQMLAPTGFASTLSWPVSDFDSPYVEVPPAAAIPPAPPAYGPPPAPAYGYGPAVMPPQEVYAVLRENGFLPLGIPRQRGLVYTIAVMDRSGEDGRLVIDARTGRIIRFVPAYWSDRNVGEDSATPYYGGPRGAPRTGYGPAPYGPQSALPPSNTSGGTSRPSAMPRVASRTPLPLPKPAIAPETAKSETARSDAAKSPEAGRQQSASLQAKPATQPVPPTSADPKPPAPQIKPTQPMPAVQDLE